MANNFNQNRMNQIGTYLKEKFGKKIIKLSLEGGFTCPNRDGTKGTGGCIFCADNGTGHFAGTISQQIRLLSDKWPDADYIAYFQNHTNTYAPAGVLREKYYSALEHEGVVGLAVATRPDCISDEALDLLKEINEKTFLWVELGLQTMHDKTAEFINRCYPLSVFEETFERLDKAGIRTVVHLIFGIPGETRDDMLDSVRYVASLHPFGIKFHMLNVVKNSRLAETDPGYIPFNSIEEYADLVISALELVPDDITIHRLSADAPRPILIAPEWSYRKRTILNTIHNEMRRRDTWQGKFAQTKSADR